MEDMDGEATAQMALKYPQTGLSVSRPPTSVVLSGRPVDKAVIAGTKANIPVMVDFGTDRPTRPLYDLLTDKAASRRHLYSHVLRPPP